MGSRKEHSTKNEQWELQDQTTLQTSFKLAGTLPLDLHLPNCLSTPSFGNPGFSLLADLNGREDDNSSFVKMMSTKARAYE